MSIKKAEVWAVAISAIALFVSGLTWFDVHRQLRLYAGQIKSYVQVVEVKLDEPITDASFIKLRLKLKNFGQTAAVNVYGEMDYQVGTPFSDGGNAATRLSFGSMGPGMERMVALTSNRINRRDWPAPRLRYYETVYFLGTIWYTDDNTLEKRKEDWCYALPLKTEDDLKQTEIEPCGILKYSSKDDR